MRFRVFTWAAVVCATAAASAAQDKPSPAPDRPSTIAEKTKGAEKMEGFVPLYWQASSGKLFLEVPRFNQELLYQISLSAGLGSNPVGLDRGQLGSSAIAFFERVGQKVLLIQPNYRYRALSTDAAERRAVEESFARSVLWGFKVEAEEGGRVLLDATSFFMRDAHGVADRLRSSNQGAYRLDDSRSALYLPRTKGFPKNSEIETMLTFTTDGSPGRFVRETTPNPLSVTLRQHHSFVELPETSYRPRRLDPRAPSFGIEFYDYASPITEAIEKRWIVRHRLEKKDPAAPVSEPVKPIIYYVDNGAPEPIRSALVEGASWWNQAFEAAGFRDAFQVRVLPPDADPMDVRYNMINWVHRSTRGWSYGGSVTDPRTGEIIKGNVTLGSLRVRQDYMLGVGLIPSHAGLEGGCLPGDVPGDDYLARLDPAVDAGAMSLARIRQLSAHEVGHTLGFAHNFAASSYNRASVMDYPAPWVEIKNGKLDLSNAYAIGIGEFDKFATRFAYSQFPSAAAEPQELERILEDGVTRGMLYIADSDGRPVGSAHPLASVWDNGTDAIATLKHEMEVRRIGLRDFGLKNIPIGTPLSELERQLVPLYLHHRYQLVAAAKSLGGVHFTYAVRTAGGPNPSKVADIVPPERQRAALDAVLATLNVDELRIPRRILDLLPPTAAGYGGGTAEFFNGRTGATFDPISAATIAADVALGALLSPERAARVIQHASYNVASPGFDDVLAALILATWSAPRTPDGYGRLLQEAVQSLTITRLMDLAANESASPQVRAIATSGLQRIMLIAGRLVTPHASTAKLDIDRFLKRPENPYKRTEPLPVPAGEPIGGR